MRRYRPVLFLLILVPWSVTASPGQEPWSLDKTLEVRNVASPAVSPDGKWVAHTVTEAIIGPDTSRYVTQIWLAAADGSVSRQLTRSPESALAPAWSPDGRWIAFLDAREKGRLNVWVIRPDGGEALRLTDAPESVGAFRWSPDGRRLAYLMPDPPTEDERKAEAARDDARVVDAIDHPSRLYWITVRPDSGAFPQPVQVTKGSSSVLGFDWAPDGKSFVICHAPTSKIYEWRNTDISVVGLDGGAVRPLVAHPGMDMGAVYSPDGRTVAFVSDRGDRCWARNWRICLVPAAGGEVRLLAPTGDAMPGESIDAGLVAWADDGSGVYFVELKGTVTGLFFAPADGSPVREVTTHPGMKSSFQVLAKRGLAAYVGEDLAEPPEVYLQPLSGNPRRLTAANDRLRGLAFSRSEVVTWPSFDNRTIEGVLFHPLNRSEGGPFPLLVELHGGPTWAFTRSYSHQTQVLTAAGFGVLQVNPRGSAGYGKDFRFANLGDWGGKDVRDVLAGVDRLVELGLADPARLGVFGWSYGGFLTAMTIAVTPRFAAAVVGAGMSNIVSSAGTTDIIGFVPSFMGSEFWDPGEPWKGHSAIDRIRDIRTPTLILHGENDARVHVTQGYELYHALRRRGVETVMVVYPRTGHGPDEPKLVRDVLRRHLDWFRSHLNF